MGWDSTRPVPWIRLMREWVIYAGIMSVVFLLFFSRGGVIGAIAGVLVSGPLYLGLGFVLAKFGYQRKTMKQLKAEREDRAAAHRDGRPPASSPSSTRPARPAPTRRTAQGPNRPTKRRKR